MHIFDKYKSGGYEFLMLGQQPRTKHPGRISCVVPIRGKFFVQWTGVKAWPSKYLDKNKYDLYNEHGSGICLKCGSLIFIDIDLESKDVVADVADLAWEMLGPGMIRTRENSNRIGLVYRTLIDVKKSLVRFRRVYSEGGKAIVNEVVEVLAQGQQFVCEGTHTSGFNYIVHNWMPFKELPVIDPQPFIDEVKNLIPKNYAVEKHPSVIKGTSLESSNVVDLFEDFEVLTEVGVVAVGEILRNPSKFHKMHCADPYEPDYVDFVTVNNRMGIIYADSNQPIISSYAHGGITYFLRDNSLAQKLINRLGEMNG